MAKPSKSVTLTASPFNMQLLATIAAATASDNGNGFTYVSEADAKPLTEALLIEVNPAMKDASGNIAARTTEKGSTMVNSQVPASPPTSAPPSGVAATSKYQIDDYVPDMTIKGRGRANGGSGSGLQADLDKLEPMKGSIHIPATDSMKEPAKSVASAISAANMRWSKGTGQFETVTLNEYQLDEKGKRVKSEDGSYIKTGEKQEQREIRESIREFRVRSVIGPNDPAALLPENHKDYVRPDPKGAGARIVRVK